MTGTEKGPPFGEPCLLFNHPWSGQGMKPIYRVSIV